MMVEVGANNTEWKAGRNSDIIVRSRKPYKPESYP
jgi:hypothetical protein